MTRRGRSLHNPSGLETIYSLPSRKCSNWTRKSAQDKENVQSELDVVDEKGARGFVGFLAGHLEAK